MEKRFTVVELVVVLVVTGILLGMLGCPARRRGPGHNEYGCIANLHALGTAYTMYVYDYGAWPTGDVAGGSSKECLYALYEPYTESKAIFSCPIMPTTVLVPGDTGYLGDSPGGNPRLYNSGYYQDSADDPAQPHGNGIPITADPMRAVAADKSTENHGDGSMVLFVDSHVKWLEMNGKDDVSNPYHLGADPNIYTDEGNNQNLDCDLNP